MAQTPVQGPRVIAYAAIVLSVVLGVVLLIEQPWTDTAFCKRLFTKLVRGRTSVEGAIAWDRLQAIGVDVAAEYNLFRLDSDRINYRKQFVKGFAMAYRQQGATLRDLVNWRVLEREPDLVTVAADAPKLGRSLQFTISKHEGRKLEAIGWGACDVPGQSASAGNL